MKLTDANVDEIRQLASSHGIEISQVLTKLPWIGDQGQRDNSVLLQDPHTGNGYSISNLAELTEFRSMLAKQKGTSTITNDPLPRLLSHYLKTNVSEQYEQAKQITADCRFNRTTKMAVYILWKSSGCALQGTDLVNDLIEFSSHTRGFKNYRKLDLRRSTGGFAIG